LGGLIMENSRKCETTPIIKKPKAIKKGIENMSFYKNKETLTVGELKEFIADLDNNMKIYIISDDETPVRKIIDISSEEQVGYYKELYLNTAEL